MRKGSKEIGCALPDTDTFRPGDSFSAPLEFSFSALCVGLFFVILTIILILQAILTLGRDSPLRRERSDLSRAQYPSNTITQPTLKQAEKAKMARESVAAGQKIVAFWNRVLYKNKGVYQKGRLGGRSLLHSPQR